MSHQPRGRQALAHLVAGLCLLYTVALAAWQLASVAALIP